MSGQATSLRYEHEFILPYSGPQLLPAPWRHLTNSAERSLHMLQNVLSGPITVPTGIPSRPTVDVPAGDTLIAVIYTSSPAVMLVGRVPFAGRRFTIAKTTRLDLPSLAPAAYEAGDTFIALAGLRGSCGGTASGTVRAHWEPTPTVPGFPEQASASGIATQPSGDAAGNISAGQVAILTSGGTFDLDGFAGSTGPCGLAIQNRRPTAHLILASEPLVFSAVPSLDSPVTLHMRESLTGVFADPTVDATFFSLVDLPVGSQYSVGDQISGQTWYSGTIRDKTIQGGLTSYTLETLLATLGRVTPREALILVAGEGGVPNPLTLRECLIRFLDYYGVPYDPDIPEFYLRAGEELVVPTVPAFVIQPDQLNPASIYEQLEPFYGVFRSYTFRADTQNRLVVTPPAWIDTIGVRLQLWRRRQEGNDRYPTRQTASAPWSTSRRPLVEWTATVDGVTYSGELPAPLELGAPLQSINIGPVTVRIQWRASDNRVQASVWPPPPSDLTVGSLYSITFTLRPETLPGAEDERLNLTVDGLGPDEVQTTSADTVINQAVIPVRARTFQPAQHIMQAGALVLASPGGVMPGLFGNTRFGPMAEDLETPSDFLELVNDTVQDGAWFWPADDTVVIQPGGNITVAYDVEEWAEQWRTASGPHAAAAQVNSYSDTVDLPANGAEVRLFDFQFPRQTTNFAPSPYGARGTVYGRWRAGESPGIELRVGNSHFVEFGYLPEVGGVFGQTVYFLWGAIVKLNGTGTTFTIGDLHTYRFGFSRGADGLWEDGANMPGLSESQALFPNRVYTAPELPYEVDHDTALAMARGIVEENLTPKAVYTLTIPPTRPDGYAVGPWHMGRAANIPALGVLGRVTALDYSEAHTAQAQGDSSIVTIDVETTTAPAGSRAAATSYRRAAYGLSHYQQEE